jgi:hypothetical protein
MTIRARLARLEKRTLAGGRCPVCRDRPAMLWRDAASADGAPEAAGADAAEPCPACGWEPDVLVIAVKIVDSPADPPAAEPEGD